ncbi:MAG: acetylglutamate kinase [Planctomycetaceae bacterium]
MNEAIRKADVLLEALEWIRHFRGRFVVIKLGGSALDDPQAVQRCLTDVIFMESVGMKPILVHGGGKAISEAMTESGIEPQFIRGRRVTDKATMEIVSRILDGEVCQSLVQRIRDQGGQAEPVNSPERQCLYAERLTLPDDSGADLGFVGKVVNVNRELLTELTDASTIPVIPSIGIEAGGQVLNINADTAAAAVARFMGAEKLMFLSDVPGIFADRQDSSSLISHLDSARCRQLVADGTIDQGMLPKVDAALEALDFGVKKVHIVDARTPHAMLLEIYSNTGIGTEIVG